MTALTVKVPNLRLVIKDKKFVFRAFVAVICLLVFIILCLIISVASKQTRVRNFEDHPLTSYHSGCRDLTSQWHVGETGTSGTIKVSTFFNIFHIITFLLFYPKVKRERSGFDHIWELEMVYDKPVQQMEVTNGIVDQVSGQRFRITPTSVYFRNSGLGTDDVKVGFKATFDKAEDASADPVLETIIINGKYWIEP